MKILIYGVDGWIGTLFTSFLDKQYQPYIKGNVRVNNIKELKEEIFKIQPTHIISFIGRTSGIYNNINFNTIDYLEQPSILKENIRDNLFSPVSLALICQKNNIHFTYLGTGCIYTYDDINRDSFTEKDLPNFYGSSYSTVKAYTDQIMAQMDDNVLNLRIRMPISINSNKRNFINKIISYKQICSIDNSMTVLETFFPIFLDLLLKNKTGTYNCTNPGVINHNQILQMYKELINPQFTWKNFTIDEQDKILYAKRSNNKLDTTKLTNEYPNIPNINDAVLMTLKNFK